MIPIANIAAAALSKGAAQTPEALEARRARSKKSLLIGGGLVLAVVAFFIVRKKIKEYNEKKKNAETNYTTGPKGLANILADRARVAMKGWGTNEKALYDIAAVVGRGETEFEDVAAAFYAKYGRNLMDDIKSELNSKELKQFYETMGKPMSGLGFIFKKSSETNYLH